MINKTRQNRIDHEILVEIDSDESANVSWNQYFSENLEFPINAVANLRKRDGEIEEVEILIVDVASEPEKELLFGFVVTMKGYVFSISLSQILSVDTSEENLEKLNDWRYWSELELLENVVL